MIRAFFSIMNERARWEVTRASRALDEISAIAKAAKEADEMTEKKNDGGPAFPIQNANFTEAYGGAPGMTLRDYFAAHALIGIGNWVHTVYGETNVSPASISATRRAHWAYAQADAMLEERSK